jgi:hypothetical protein
MFSSLIFCLAKFRDGLRPRPVQRVLLCLGLVAIITGCGNGKPSGLGPWQEEVQLADGRVIVVERFEDSEVRGPIGDAKDSFIRSTTIKFIAPPDLAALPVLSMPYRPILLDYDPRLGTWFAIGVNERACLADAFNSGQMDPTGLINLHPNFEFRLLDGQWQGVEIEPGRTGLPANLLIRRITIEKWNAEHRPVPLAEKRRLDGQGNLPEEYRHVTARLGCG